LHTRVFVTRSSCITSKYSYCKDKCQTFD